MKSEFGFETRAAQVARSLAEQVETGRRRPGERLWEEDLAAEFGCARGTVREALAHLAQEGLVVPSLRRGGVSVVEFSDADLGEIYDIRGVLFGLAIRLFVEGATAEEREAYIAYRESLWCGLPPAEAKPEDCTAVGGPSVLYILDRCGSARLAASYRRVALQAIRLYAPLHYRTAESRELWRVRCAMLAAAVRLGDAAAAEAASRALIHANKLELLKSLAEGHRPPGAIADPPRTRRAG
jgi:DNA-binding GntR family transcriptional regulator